MTKTVRFEIYVSVDDNYNLEDTRRIARDYIRQGIINNNPSRIRIGTTPTIQRN